MDVRRSGTEALGLEEWQERYARQLLLPEVGREGQELLARKSIAVVGAGGLGSTLLPILVGAGVGEVLILGRRKPYSLLGVSGRATLTAPSRPPPSSYRPPMPINSSRART